MPKNKISRKSNLSDVRCIWGLVCSMSSIDQQRNNISLFNVIDQLSIPKSFKDQALKEGKKVFDLGLEHEVVFLLRRTLPPKLCSDQIVVDMKLSVVDPNGIVLSEILKPIEFKSGQRVMRFRVQSNSFKISDAGDYTYHAELSARTSGKFSFAAEVPFHVLFV